MLANIPVLEDTTIPSLVTSQGNQISYTFPSSPHHQNPRGPQDASQDISLPQGEIYIKLTAFGGTFYLNLSLSDLEEQEILVEYVGRNGSIEGRAPRQNSCHYTGHVHSSVGDGWSKGEELGSAMEGSWTAISTCNGLVRVYDILVQRLPLKRH